MDNARRLTRSPRLLTVAALVFVAACSPSVDGAEQEAGNPDGIHIVIGPEYDDAEAAAFEVLGDSTLHKGVDYWSSGFDGDDWTLIVQFRDGHGAQFAQDFRALGFDVIELAVGDRWPGCNGTLGCFVE